MEIMVIFWFLLGLVTYRQAVNKGYNKWCGLIMGILFGIFAVYVYALLVDKNKAFLLEKQEKMYEHIAKQEQYLKDLELRINTRIDNIK